MSRPAPAKFLAGCTVWWCLGLAGCGGGGAPKHLASQADGRASPPQQRSLPATLFFEDAAPGAGVEFVASAPGAEDHFFPAIMGGGAALFDLENDGDLDVLLVDAALPARLATRNEESERPAARIFRQEDGGRFADITGEIPLTTSLYGMGACVGDVNNDGLADIFLSGYRDERLLVQSSPGAFVDVTRQAGLGSSRWGMSAALCDFDRDGWLDLFVVNYVEYDPGQACRGAGGRTDFCNPAEFPRSPARLLRNITGESNSKAEVRFEDVSLASGIAIKKGAGLGVLCGDFDDDGWQDVYVANDGHANFLWINQRNGEFRDEGVLRGVAYDAAGRGQGSMGIAAGFLNEDDRLDLLTTNLDGENNALYLSQGESYLEVSQSRGLAPSFPNTGFGVVFADLDLDGDEDLVVANGRVRRAETRPGGSRPAAAGGEARAGGEAKAVGGAKPGRSAFWDDYREQSALYLARDGAFTVASGLQQDPLSAPAVARAIACGDIDNDGDCDLLVSRLDGTARLLRNIAKRQGHWLLVKATDPAHGGRDAYGAVVTIRSGQRYWRRVLSPCASYLSTHDPRLHFGLGETTTIDEILVRWPTGETESFPGGAVDQLVKVARGQGSGRDKETPSPPQ